MTNAITNTITLGAMTGVRTMAGPVCAAQLQSGTGLARARGIIDALAIVESLADKIAPLPARTHPVPLLGRAATGAALGWLLNEKNRAGHALLGAAAAAASAFLAVRLRRVATKRFGIPDFAMGLAEDAALAGAGLALLRATRASRETA